MRSPVSGHSSARAITSSNAVQSATSPGVGASTFTLPAAIKLIATPGAHGGDIGCLARGLEERFISVNKRIEYGSNQHIKVVGVGAKRRWSWSIPTDEEEPVNSPF